MSAGTVVARYLAAGGAHVSLVRDDDTQWLTAVCDACGFVADACYRDVPAVHRHLERDANAHATRCRRIPKRLWTKDGDR